MKDSKTKAAIGIPALDLENLTVVSAEEFAKLQAKNGKLYVLDVKIDETENYQFIAKRPSRATLSAVADNKNDMDKANDILLKNMLVAGNMDSLNDGVVFGQVMKELANIMQQGNSFLTKA